MKRFASGLQYPSGPIAMADGSVVVVEIEGGDLTRLHPDGTRTVIAHCGGGPNGAAVGPDGAFYVCNNGGLRFRTEDDVRRPVALADDNPGGCLQRVDAESGSVDVVFTHVDGTRLGSLNDIVFDANGSCYFVDTTAGTVLYADPLAGSITVVAASLAFPNGIDLSADGRQLFVTETYSGRLLAFDVAAGKLGPPQTVATMSGHGWDGIAVDSLGNICCANLEKSGVTSVAEDGTVTSEVTVPVYDPHVTNICFGGADLCTAFVTSSGRGAVYATHWPHPGEPLRFVS